MKYTRLRIARRERLVAAGRSIASDVSIKASPWNSYMGCAWTLFCWLFWLFGIVGILLLVALGCYLISDSSGATWNLQLTHVSMVLCLVYTTKVVFTMRRHMVKLLNNGAVQ